ncbi:SUKH-4 family immunity protein [Nocardia sp. NPDC052566]|uniref:SUKH-4 family immunity protein n=1 Tax=Nocardia sp. NPDC052566 TaxID=3364330 RepID=UPI0037C79EFD
MATEDNFWTVWGGAEGTTPAPIAEWKFEFKAPIESYPDVDFLPNSVSYIYSTLQGEMTLYSRLQLQSHADDEEFVISTILLGVVPDCAEMLFLFDADRGAVLFLDLTDGIPELVNSSLRSFVEFLYRFAIFVEGDQGKSSRADRARELRAILAEIDGEAFDDPMSWWSLTFQELERA